MDYTSSVKKEEPNKFELINQINEFKLKLAEKDNTNNNLKGKWSPSN